MTTSQKSIIFGNRVIAWYLIDRLLNLRDGRGAQTLGIALIDEAISLAIDNELKQGYPNVG